MGETLADPLALSSHMEKTRDEKVAWVVCLTAGLFFFYEFFQLNLFDVINHSLRDAFDIDAMQLSWMSSMYLWANVLFLLPAGAILDRYSTRKVILAAMGLCVLATLGFGFSYSFFWASFFHFLAGIGNAFCFLSCVVLTVRWFSPRQQALVIGCIVTLAFIGGMVAHTPLAYLNALLGWRDAVLIDGLFGIGIFCLIFIFVRDNPEYTMMISNKPKHALHFMSALKNKQNWLGGIFTACLNLPIMVLGALWGDSYLRIVHGFSSMEASVIISLLFLGSIVGCPLVGWMSDRLGRRKPLMVLGAIATFFLFIPLLTLTMLSGLLLGLIFFLIGLFTSAQVLAYPLIAESNPSHQTGAATGFASVIIMGGAAVAQVLFGFLMKYNGQLGNYTVADYQFALWLFPFTLIVSLFMVLAARESFCKQSPG